MKQKTNTGENVAVLPQICNLIPRNLVSKAVNRVREQQGIKVCARAIRAAGRCDGVAVVSAICGAVDPAAAVMAAESWPTTRSALPQGNKKQV